VRHDLQVQGRASAGKVLGRWLHRTAATAFATWKEHGDAQAHNRSIVMGILGRWCCRQLAGALIGWKSNADEQRRGRRVLGRVASRWRHRACGAALERWRMQVRDKARVDRLVGKAARRLLNRGYARGFSGWKEAAHRQGRGRAVCAKAVVRLVQQRMGRSWEAWVKRAAEGRRGRAVCARAIRRWTGRVLFCAFHSLKEKAWNSAQLGRMEDICDSIVQRILRNMMCSALDTWRGTARERRRMRSACTRLILRLMNRTLDRALRHWTFVSKESARRRAVVRRVVQRMRHALLSWILDEWHASTSQEIDEGRGTLIWQAVKVKMQHRPDAAACHTSALLHAEVCAVLELPASAVVCLDGGGEPWELCVLLADEPSASWGGHEARSAAFLAKLLAKMLRGEAAGPSSRAPPRLTLAGECDEACACGPVSGGFLEKISSIMSSQKWSLEQLQGTNSELCASMEALLSTACLRQTWASWRRWRRITIRFRMVTHRRQRELASEVLLEWHGLALRQFALRKRAAAAAERLCSAAVEREQAQAHFRHVVSRVHGVGARERGNEGPTPSTNSSRGSLSNPIGSLSPPIIAHETQVSGRLPS